MNVKELAKQIGEAILPLVEQLVVKEIEAKSDMLVDKALDEITKLIPGQIDNMLIEPVKPQIKATVKAEALKLADKIS